MDLVRLFLFSGLAIHKLVWEVLKVRDHAAPSPSSPGWIKRIVKFGKVGVLLFLIAQTLLLDILPITSEPTLWRVVGVFIFVLGLAVAIAGRAQLGKNWANLEDRQVLRGQQLVRSGIYRYIRHPIYTGDLLLLMGLEFALNSWLVLGVFVLLVIIVKQTATEEAVLARAFTNYDEYCRQTKRFIPFII